MNSQVVKNVIKGVATLATAVCAIFLGKKSSDDKHEPMYEKQRQQAKDINDLYRKKYS